MGAFGMYGFAQSRPSQYASADHTAVVSSGEDFVQGHMEWGTKMADLLRSFGLQKATPGHPVYITMENEQKTYKAGVSATGDVTNPQLFAEVGGESVAQDADGRVYIAAGQILVYSPDGKLIDRIDVPERPIDLVFGGGDRRTLYILAHHSLYAVRTLSAGL